MIQRIQTLYLLVAFIAMLVCAIISFDIILVAVAAILAAIGSLATIFLYNKRPLQANVCRILCIYGVAFIVYFFISHSDGPEKAEIILPVATTAVAILCWLLAARAIIKDEKLVRSLDRIR